MMTLRGSGLTTANIGRELKHLLWKRERNKWKKERKRIEAFVVRERIKTSEKKRERVNKNKRKARKKEEIEHFLSYTMFAQRQENLFEQSNKLHGKGLNERIFSITQYKTPRKPTQIASQPCLFPLPPPDNKAACGTIPSFHWRWLREYWIGVEGGGACFMCVQGIESNTASHAVKTRTNCQKFFTRVEFCG